MQYAIISVINGNFKIEVETNSLQQALVNFHGKCQTLWNAPDVLQARVAIINQRLNVVDGHIEYIEHAPEPEPEEETPVE